MQIEHIVARQSVSDLPVDDAVECVGWLIDHASDQSETALARRALEWCDEIGSRDPAASSRALLEYFRANAWDCLQQKAQSDRTVAWAWDQPELQNQVIHLRRAMTSPGFVDLHAIRRCQILTNLANQMNRIGRFVEARAYWTQALAIEPNFWMASGNRARGLTYYANALYDHGHAEVFGLYALRELKAATALAEQQRDIGHEDAAQVFLRHAKAIEPIVERTGIAEDYRPDGHSLGATQRERAYRAWCLGETLFLNPLNDLEPRSIAARDILTLPSFTTGLREPPVLVGYFNVIKQEYVSARWTYYEALQSDRTHFSDADVLLYDTLDYATYGLGVEKLKAAYRATYSLFDKIAFFLNHYLRLGISHRETTFRGIWRKSPKSPLRQQFEESENWPFRGLYWLSKDLFEEDFQEVIEPQARALSQIRNHLEHRYLKVHEILVRRSTAADAVSDPFFDSLAHSITREDLALKCLHLLKLARAALIYLSLGMHREEQRRNAKRPKGGITAQMPLVSLVRDP